MHELSIAIEILRVALARAGAAPDAALDSVRIAVGDLSGVEPGLLRFAWQAVVAGTPHEGAALEIEWQPATQACARCGPIAERQPGRWLRLCPHCDGPLQVRGGDALDLLDASARPPVRRTPG